MIEHVLSHWITTVLLPRLFPLPAGHGTEGPDLATLKARFRWLGVSLAVVGAVLFFPFGILLWLLFKGISDWLASTFEPAKFHFHSLNHGAELVVPALLAAIPAATALYYLSARLWLGSEDYPLVVRYRELVSNLSVRRANRRLSMICVVLSALCFVGMINYRTVVYPDRMVCQSWFGFKTLNRPFNTITAMMTSQQIRAPNGDLVNRPGAVIRFRDGSEWDADDELTDDDPAVISACMAYIARQSGQKIQQVAVKE